MPKNRKSAISVETVVPSIMMLRGHKVLLDAELARLYRVETRVLVQAVKRNPERFPGDFMFQLSAEETAALRSQSLISNAPGCDGRRYFAYAFTEQGVAMLSAVLKSPQAIAVNIEIMRASSDCAGCSPRTRCSRASWMNWNTGSGRMMRRSPASFRPSGN